MCVAQRERSREFCECHNEQLPPPLVLTPLYGQQIRNRKSLQSPAARVLAETELWALREAKLQLEKTPNGRSWQPHQSAHKAAMPLWLWEEGSGNAHLETVFKHQFQGLGNNSEKIRFLH